MSDKVYEPGSNYITNLPVMMGSLGFHLSSSISPSRDTLSRNRGRREVEHRSLWRHTETPCLLEYVQYIHI